MFRTLYAERRGPIDGLELGMLLEYAALQWVRVPTFRSFIERILEREFADQVLSSREAWINASLKAGVHSNDPDTDYKTALERIAGGHLKMSVSTAYHLKRGGEVLEDLTLALERRRWGWLVSERGQFIGSDNPVAMDGESRARIGFENAGVVTYTVNRFVTLYGTKETVTPPPITTKLIARHNTFAMLCADEQTYSHREDFHWLDHSDKSRNDWQLFAAEDFDPEAEESGGVPNL